MHRPLTGLSLALIAVAAPAQVVDQEAALEGWPRELTSDGHKIVAYQPQLESWKGQVKLHARMAVTITPKGATEESWAAIELSADTATDIESRTVLVDDIVVENVVFPDAEHVDAEQAQKTVMSLLGGNSFRVSLDRILAAVDVAEQRQREVEVNFEPPPIFYSDSPAILVIFLGEPQFETLKGTDLLFAVNTNWDVLLDKSTGRYYLLDDDSWLTTEDPFKGPWKPATDLPDDFRQLPDDDNWKEVRAHVPGVVAKAMPKVFVTKQPAEILVTDGTPRMEMIFGTKLFWASNTESDLFLHIGENNYYFLVAGRWFRAKDLAGPWIAATEDLPAEFAKIPEDHEQADVLASVPGTAAATEAVIQASIPRRATVKREDAEVEVVYEGDPSFEQIEKTTVYYAVNTSYDVFRVDGRYYCCHNGVWFVGTGAKGPWSVCDKIPSVLYSIPSTHPKHNVTYVYVYDSTPDTVVVGYTSGYTGSYVAASGLIMFGLGYWLAHEHHDHWHSCYFSYGCGAYYSHYHGCYYRASHCYGPHGGAGRSAVYNPHTGGWARGAYAYGPSGSRFAAEGYNPWTGRYGATVQRSNGYQSWGRSVVSTDDGWVRSGHKSGPEGRARAIETSEGGKGVRKVGPEGSRSIAKDKDNNVYVGKDGKVFKRDSSGEWQQRKDGGWSDPDWSGGAKTSDRATTGQTKGRTGATTGRTGASTGRSGSNNRSSVERSWQSRNRGSSRTSRYGSSGSSRSRSRSRPGRSGSYGGSRSRGGSRGSFGGGRRR